MKRKQLLISLVVMVVIWQALAVVIDRPILPSPLKVASILPSEVMGSLSIHLLASFWRVIASTVLAIALAAPLGLILGQSPRLNQIVSPYLYILYPIPKVVFVPILVLFLGIGDFSGGFHSAQERMRRRIRAGGRQVKTNGWRDRFRLTRCGTYPDGSAAYPG